MNIYLSLLDRDGIAYAQKIVIVHHYLHHPVDARCSVEGYGVTIEGLGPVGYLLFGRPEATRCGNWYGSVDDVQSGKCEVTRWQVLNLARVYLFRAVQPGGSFFSSGILPGFYDRKDNFRSTLASEVLKIAAGKIGLDYLIQRPPCFLEEPYEIKYLLSYCDTRLHKGTIYRAAGFELYRTNKAGIQTWRLPLRGLTAGEDDRVREASRVNPRSIRYRAQRAQLDLFATR